MGSSVICSAVASAGPICFKITLIVLTVQNALLAGICPSFLLLILRSMPLVPPAGQWRYWHVPQGGSFHLKENTDQWFPEASVGRRPLGAHEKYRGLGAMLSGKPSQTTRVSHLDSGA